MKEFFIIWNPDSDFPPSKQFATREQAEYIAERMARENEGEAFYVLRAVAVAHAQAVVLTRIDSAVDIEQAFETFANQASSAPR